MGLSALSSPKEEIMKTGLNLETVITLSGQQLQCKSQTVYCLLSSRSCVIINQI